MAWVAADVDHQSLDAVCVEAEEFGMDLPDAIIVAVPVNPLERLEVRDDVARGDVAEIPCVPNLVHRLQELPQAVIEDAVSVGNEAYVHQPSNLDDDLLAVQPHGHP